MTREEQAMWAIKLQTALNDGEYNGDYRIHFDALDSGMTDCYYKHSLYKTVPNDEMCGSINVVDFKAPTELIIAYM